MAPLTLSLVDLSTHHKWSLNSHNGIQKLFLISLSSFHVSDGKIKHKKIK